MIVFPLIRSGGLKAATASSRAATLPDHARRALPDVSADDIENEIDSADVVQVVVPEVDELLCAEVEGRLPVGGTSGTDDVPPASAYWLRAEPLRFKEGFETADLRAANALMKELSE